MNDEQFKNTLIKLETLKRHGYHNATIQFDENRVTYSTGGITEISISWDKLEPFNWKLLRNQYNAFIESNVMSELDEIELEETKQWREKTKSILTKLRTLPAIGKFYLTKLDEDTITWINHEGWAKTVSWDKLTINQCKILKEHYEEYIEKLKYNGLDLKGLKRKLLKLKTLPKMYFVKVKFDEEGVIYFDDGWIKKILWGELTLKQWMELEKHHERFIKILKK